MWAWARGKKGSTNVIRAQTIWNPNTEGQSPKIYHQWNNPDTWQNRQWQHRKWKIWDNMNVKNNPNQKDPDAQIPKREKNTKNPIKIIIFKNQFCQDLEKLSHWWFENVRESIGAGLVGPRDLFVSSRHVFVSSQHRKSAVYFTFATLTYCFENFYV